MAEIISFSGVDIFQAKKCILSNISFTVNKGEFLYLIGKTGSGKSSLLKSLYGEIPIKVGNACIMDFDLLKLRKRKILLLRRQLGIIFQDFQLLSDRNIQENLRFVLRATGWKKSGEIQNKINEVLALVGMETSKLKMPHQLSGGEQQRIAIGRALLNNPAVILADEPTGNLDPDTTVEIMKLLQKISNDGKTIVMATHDYEMIKKFPSRTIKCLDGKLHEINLMDPNEFLH